MRGSRNATAKRAAPAAWAMPHSAANPTRPCSAVPSAGSLVRYKARGTAGGGCGVCCTTACRHHPMDGYCRTMAGCCSTAGALRLAKAAAGPAAVVSAPRLAGVADGPAAASAAVVTALRRAMPAFAVASAAAAARLVRPAGGPAAGPHRARSAGAHAAAVDAVVY